MSYSMKLYYIAYFDILGYKSFFEDEGNNVYEFLKTNVQLAKEIIRKTKWKCAILEREFSIKSFSDNFVILIAADNHNDGNKEVKALSYLMALFQLRFLQQYKVLLRGSITKGQCYVDENIVFGEGLIRAVLLEEQANYPRIIIDSEEGRIGTKLYEDMFENFVCKDEDNTYYVNFFEVLNSSENVDSEHSDFVLIDKDISISTVRSNIISLVKKYGKYIRSVKDPVKIADEERTITKYAWLLIKFNNYCKLNELNQEIQYSLVFYHRIMRCEIKITE